jgi:hypothetical protein
MIQSLLSIARRMSTRELPFRKINLNVGRNTRTVEAQITVNAIGEYVIVLRDVTLASVAQD